MPKYLTQIRMIQHPDGRVTCLNCNYTWRMFKQLKDRKCRNCRCPMWPAPMAEDTHSHYECRDGLCTYIVLDWAVVRQPWMAFPAKEGLVWKVAEKKPFTIHDVMVAFRIDKFAAKNWLLVAMGDHWLTRERKSTPPPDEVHKYKGSYYGRKGVKNRPQKRRKRSALYRFTPTDQAMQVYMRRFPDKVKMLRKGDRLWWSPTLVRKEKRIVKYTLHCLPRTSQERKELGKRLMQNLTHNKVGLPVSRLM